MATEGSSIEVKVRGLKWREAFTINIDGVTLATSKAPWFGAAKVTAPLGATTVGSKTLVATGSTADRTGSCPITIAKLGGAAAFTKRI
jgi:hypothetical protein